FLPGDSLLFVAGAIAGVGGLDIGLLIVLLTAAAILGDAVNYSIGRKIGPKVFGWEQSRFFNRAAFDRTHDFYERHGPITIVVARFLPFVRTFAPFVAGVAQMHYPRFALYNIAGGILWVVSLTTLGYIFGNTEWVRANFSVVALAMIIIPGLPAVFEVVRQSLRSRRARAAIEGSGSTPRGGTRRARCARRGHRLRGTRSRPLRRRGYAGRNRRRKALRNPPGPRPCSLRRPAARSAGAPGRAGASRRQRRS